MALRVFSRKKSKDPTGHKTGKGAALDELSAARSQLADDLLLQAVHLGRLGLIVTQPQRWQHHPRFNNIYQGAMQAIDERFGLVPEGFAGVPQTINDHFGASEQEVETPPFLVARHAVTNAEYQMFVDGGGYQDLDLWPEHIWPHLIDFIDLSGESAPRFWKHGRHSQRLAHHPVVGVCFYEAEAYARWAGFRLPSEAEWQMAATWCIRSAAHTVRRYPWGDAFDVSRCNIWASGNADVLHVDACPSGVAPNGVLQLIGNVWEWTDADFESTDHEGRTIVGDALMKSVRGGAYDTYFPWQATGTFRTGLTCLLRPHNVGLRCAMDLPESWSPESAAD